MANRCARSSAGVAPTAHLGNGLMDVVLVSQCSRKNFLKFLLALAKSETHSPVSIADESGETSLLVLIHSSEKTAFFGTGHKKWKRHAVSSPVDIPFDSKRVPTCKSILSYSRWKLKKSVAYASKRESSIPLANHHRLFSSCHGLNNKRFLIWLCAHSTMAACGAFSACYLCWLTLQSCTSICICIGQFL